MKILVALLLCVSLCLAGCHSSEPPADALMPNENSGIEYNEEISQSENAGSDSSINEEQELVSNIPINENFFTEEQKGLITLSKNMYIAHVNITDELSNADKARFFMFIISTNLYKDKYAEWKIEESYCIPLSQIKEIIYAHLNTSDFDPVEGFCILSGSRKYDSNKEAYITDDMGGYGGAAALGVLQYTENGNRTSILLGVYDMNMFFDENPAYDLLASYQVEILTEDGLATPKILFAETIPIT